jgi:hypothetical protein
MASAVDLSADWVAGGPALELQIFGGGQVLV